MYEWYLDVRDNINNKFIRFLLRHCGLHNPTLRACMNKATWQSCALIVEDMKGEKKENE